MNDITSKQELDAITETEKLEVLLQRLHARRAEWGAMSILIRIEMLQQIRARIPGVAQQWIDLSDRAKGIAPDSPLEGEEWTSGPWALMSCCDHLIATLGQIAENGIPDVGGLAKRKLPDGQLSVEVFPLNIFDRLLLSGVRAEVWMEKGVTEANLADNLASHYRRDAQANGELGLILGAGNISSITPLDALHKLFTEKSVAIVKLNPINDYLLPIFEDIFSPLIARDYVHFVRGGSRAGATLCTHPLVDTIHITGSQITHDAIVFGTGAEGEANRAANHSINPKPISSELGAVCPTIVVPGPWSKADIDFQASNIATQKLHNSGFNCIACQVLILPEDWSLTAGLRTAVREKISSAPDRRSYYPGVVERQAELTSRYRATRHAAVGAAANREIITLSDQDAAVDYAQRNEVFGPTLCEQFIGGADAETYLQNAINFSNDKLRGTLGANILIHPATIKAFGPKFDSLLQELRYGCIAVNAWTGLGFLLTVAPWGAFPGHVLNDAQSGIGIVHNTFMFDRPQRTIVYAPFRPFPRGLLSGAMTLLPKPPWFVNNRRAHRVGKKLFAFQAKPSWFKLPGIFIDALRG